MSFADLTDAQRSKLRLREGSKITVCSACKRAGCWAGINFCDEARGAGTVTISIAQAREMGLEHPDYWVSLREAEGFVIPRLVREMKNGV